MNIVIKSPLKGLWAIVNAPGHPELAFNFVAVDDKKNPYPISLLLPHLLGHIHVKSVFAWEKPVFSPFQGEVVDCHDGEDDCLKISLLKDIFSSLFNRPKNRSDFSQFGGNYIVLRNDEGNVFSLLAHLKLGQFWFIRATRLSKDSC